MNERVGSYNANIILIDLTTLIRKELILMWSWKFNGTISIFGTEIKGKVNCQNGKTSGYYIIQSNVSSYAWGFIVHW